MAILDNWIPWITLIFFSTYVILFKYVLGKNINLQAIVKTYTIFISDKGRSVWIVGVSLGLLCTKHNYSWKL